VLPGGPALARQGQPLQPGAPPRPPAGAVQGSLARAQRRAAGGVPACPRPTPRGSGGRARSMRRRRPARVLCFLLRT